MGLENIGGWELIALILLGLFIFGPDRLPKAIADGLRMLRQLRAMARNATTDLSRELGTDIQLEDLNPRSFVRKHLLSEEDEAALRKPLQDIYGDMRDAAKSLDPGPVRLGGPPEPTADPLPGGNPAAAGGVTPGGNGSVSGAGVVPGGGAARPARPQVFDTDAT
jgi:sec-independent protein translocase protein TatB